MEKTLPESSFSPQMEVFKPFRAGEIVEGKVVGTGRSAIYLDLGPRGTGIIYGREFLIEKNRLKEVALGDTLAAKIVELENEEGYIELSLGQAGKELSWKELREKKEAEELMKVKVVGANKGGLLAELNGMQAFLPVSQLSQEHYPKVEGGDPTKILRELQKFMGKELEVEILDLDPRDQKIILSEKSKEKNKLRELLSSYKAGDVVEGEITGVVDFGAFMQFGAPEPIEGLVHISEIDWQIIEDPSKFLKIGDKVQAKIIDIASGRVSLSLKALKEDPWKEVEKKYAKQSVVQGKVTKLNPFGAFVEIEPKIQALCHISEFGTKTKMEETLQIEGTYAFQVLEVNPQEHRMSLRLASKETALPQAQEPPQEEPQEAQP